MKKILLILMTVALCSLSSHAQTLHAYEGAVKSAYNFMVYVPENYEDGKTEMPLVVFLHGKSLSGTDLSRVRRYGPLSALQYGRHIPALILAPQSPGDGWKPAKVNELIDWTISNYDVDTTRIYVIGMSMGGFGTIDYVATYPKRVAAAVAMCGGATVKDLSKLKQVPLWLVHGVEDTAVPVMASDKVYEAVQQSAPDGKHLTHYDRLDSVNHAMLARMFYLNQTYDWLFMHSTKSRPRVIHDPFPVREALPKAYKGLKSNSVKIDLVNIKNGKKPALKPEKAVPAVKDSINPAAKPETESKEKSGDGEAATEQPEHEKADKSAAHEKSEEHALAQERAVKEQAEQEAAQLAAKRKAEAEAKKRAEAEAKKKAEAEAKKKAEAEAAAKRKAEAKKKAQEEARKKAQEEARKKAQEAARWHVVKSGESQWSIANKHGISIAQLRKWNKLDEKSVIHPGQKLRVKP